MILLVMLLPTITMTRITIWLLRGRLPKGTGRDVSDDSKSMK